jgi:hypothetical protein
MTSTRKTRAVERAQHEADLRRLFPENYRHEQRRCATPPSAEQAWAAEQAFARASLAAECIEERVDW